MWNPWRSRSDDGGNSSRGYARIAATEDPDNSDNMMAPYPCLSQEYEESSSGAEDSAEQEEDGDDTQLRPGDHVYG